jgi:DHA1 family inner membrane transport protein
MLRQVTGLGTHEVTWVLLLFGIGLTIGNLVGGRLADWRLVPSVIGAYAAVVVVLTIFALVSQFPGAAAVTVTVWGAAAFALISPLQMWVVDSASDAPNLASTLNQSAFNLGNSIGAWLGGVVLACGVRYAELPWIGAAAAAIGLVIVLAATVRSQPVNA